MMILRSLACPQCRAILPRVPEGLNRQRCPSCSIVMEFVTFPALDRELPAGNAGELVVTDGEASCFYHPAKRATVPCSACGRFLCALCDVEIEGRHYCAACYEKGSRTGSIPSLERKRFRYDNLAISLVTLPLLFPCGVVLTAPIAVYIVLRYWQAPGSLVQNSRLRMIIALVLAIVEFIAAVAMMAVMFHMRHH